MSVADRPATWATDSLILEACAFLYKKYVKLDKDGDVSGRKHWTLMSSDLADKFGLSISANSLKEERENIKTVVSRIEGKVFNQADARKSIREAYPDLFNDLQQDAKATAGEIVDLTNLPSDSASDSALDAPVALPRPPKKRKLQTVSKGKGAPTAASSTGAGSRSSARASSLAFGDQFGLLCTHLGSLVREMQAVNGHLKTIAGAFKGQKREKVFAALARIGAVDGLNLKGEESGEDESDGEGDGSDSESEQKERKSKKTQDKDEKQPADKDNSEKQKRKRGGRGKGKGKGTKQKQQQHPEAQKANRDSNGGGSSGAVKGASAGLATEVADNTSSKKKL